MIRTTLGGRRSVAIGFAAVFLFAFAMRFILTSMASHFVPFERTRLRPIAFVHYRLPFIIKDWHEVLLVVSVWSALLLGVLTYLARSRSTDVAPAVFIVTQVILLALLVTAPLPIDSDQFAYVGYGAAVMNRENPYRPAELPANAPRVQRRIAAHWGNPIQPDRYGPIWTLLNAALLWPVRDRPVEQQTFVLRCAAAAAAIVSSLLIAASVENRRRRRIALAAFTLSPLVIIEAGSGAHNDMYMIVCAAAAVYALRRDRLLIGALFLGLAIGIKFAYAPLAVPLLAYVYRCTRSMTATLGAALGVVAPVLLSGSFFGVRASLVWPVIGATSGGSVLASLPHLDRMNHEATDALLAAAIAVATLLASWRILRGLAPYAMLTAVLVMTWCYANKIEAWYGILLTPMLVTPMDACPALFYGVTTGSLLMLSGAFLNVYPAGLTLASATALSLAAYLLIGGKDRDTPANRIRRNPLSGGRASPGADKGISVSRGLCALPHSLGRL
jgi:alpha-1,6-mannosyltransferase